MKILIAEDDAISRRTLEVALTKWGYQVSATCNGTEAWDLLQQEMGPVFAILDVRMPGMDGIELCRKLRELNRPGPTYIILLTAQTAKTDVARGLEEGADDYIAKPFDYDELRARVRAGVRIVELQQSLIDRLREKEEALSQVKQLQGMLPICSYCKSIRDDHNYWQRVDDYISVHTDVLFSHGICPKCYDLIVQPQLDELEAALKTGSVDAPQHDFNQR